jgi:hypothetical protein
VVVAHTVGCSTAATILGASTRREGGGTSLSWLLAGDPIIIIVNILLVGVGVPDEFELLLTVSTVVACGDGTSSPDDGDDDDDDDDEEGDEDDDDDDDDSLSEGTTKNASEL